MAVAEYPGAPMVDTDETLRQKVERNIVPQIVAGLARASSAPVAAELEPSPRDIVFTGTLDETLQVFHDRLWSDGLPIVPPTLDRVDRFLDFTERSPDDVLGVLPVEARE